MEREIEKKFLLSKLPKGLKNGEEILQEYLLVGDPEVRIRKKDNKYFITRKVGCGFVRMEKEIEIPCDVYIILLDVTEGVGLEKIRFNITGSDGLVWEIDQYLGWLNGLYVAEVELPEENSSYIMPPEIEKVFVLDVTEDERYKNGKLAVNGIPKR